MEVPGVVELHGTAGASEVVARPETVQPPGKVETPWKVEAPGAIEAPGAVERPEAAQELQVDQRLSSPPQGPSSISVAASDPSRNEMFGADTGAG